MKRSGRCTKCDHHRILHITEVPDGGTLAGDTTDQRREAVGAGHYSPLRVARIPDQPDRFFGGATQRAAGLVEAFVCRQCGFTELYTRSAEQIPVDGDLVRELVAPHGTGPFR